MDRKWFAWLFTLLILHNEVVFSAYHWKLSEDGKKIEAVMDTPYHMRMPGSLTDFMKQVENVKVISQHVDDMQGMWKKISKHENFDNPKFEEDFRQQEEACVKSRGIKLEPDSFHTSFTAELCPEFHESYQQYTAFVKEYFGSPPDTDKRPPRCNYWFEAVKMKGQNNVDLGKSMNEKVGAEDEMYLKVLDMYFPDFAKFTRGSEGMSRFGNMLSSMLSHDDERVSRNAYLHMAAAAYWRAQGKISYALTCYATGIHFVNDESKAPNIDSFHPAHAEQTVRLSIATLLNRAGYSVEAYIILKQLTTDNMVACYKGMMFAATADASVLTGPESNNSDPETEKPTIQLKLTQKERNGIFSKTFHNYAKAASEFKDAKKEQNQEDGGLLDQFFDLGESKAYVISCHMRLYEALEQQKDNLESLVNEKNNFQKSYKKRDDLKLKVMALLSSNEIRANQKLFYDQVKYGPHPFRKCQRTQVNRFPSTNNKMNVAATISCTVSLTCSPEKYEELMAPLREKTLRNRPPINETAWKVTEVYPRNRAFEKTLLDISRDCQKEGYFRMIPPRFSDKEVDETADRYWRRADWPNSLDCQAVVSASNPFRINTFPQVFISPENRGWIISELLTTHLGLLPADSLPLPWFEPRCDFVKMDDLRVFTGFEAIERLLNPRFDRKTDEYAERTLKTQFVRLADRVMEEHEMAARIHLLIKHTNFQNIGPKWVSLNLAGLYWRVQGNAHQATKCLLGAFLDKPGESFISIVQLTQVMLKATRMINDANGFLMQQLNLLGYKEPLFHFVQGRMKMLLHDVDKAIQHLKEAMDRDPENVVIEEDLLKIACGGQSTKLAISSLYPTVCCSMVTQNAVCIRPRKEMEEQCYVVEPHKLPNAQPILAYHRCNGYYDGFSKKTQDYASIVSPFLTVFNHVTSRNDVSNWVNQVDGIQTVESSEMPLDYGGWNNFFTERPAEWWDSAINEMKYVLPTKKEKEANEWEETWNSDLAKIPEKPLSFLWIREKSVMKEYDAKLPSDLPKPSTHQIRRGIAIFPPPRVATMSCNGVAKPEAIFENAPSTWVSLTAKGEDIEKYVDLRGPMPAMASLQPVCPTMDKYKNSPILGLDHIPAFALSDQFLFYQPEKALSEALKSLGNERDTIEHVAARLHAAMLLSNTQDGQVNWVLCVLSSLYWRVTGNAENAMGCLRCALHTAPPNMRDVALVSLANICHQAGLLNSALISAGAALSTSPRLVAIHFTLGNIYASIGDYQRALNFYYSTLSLQSNFQPAKDRIRTIYCHASKDFEF
ncbi:Protein CBG19140 [Caenorhabditis briggsae]|uniref:Protein CBG19140 n=1 Tax=Caenorhabditis briggsae TaxID=6238 RepID=A8XUX0_CAEBR|nr:Protein CBG19140 [Caenorhabditis briggsae]CAP36437.2 Protein CBG19140 [Caenorhabditis briggsae]